MSLGFSVRRSRIAVVLVSCMFAVGTRVACAQPPPPPPAQQPPPPAEQPPAEKSADDGVVFVGAGDIANCEVSGASGARATAALLARFPDAVIFTTGDHAYPTGSDKDFKTCYEPTWGRY